MSLRDLEYQEDYRSGYNDLIGEFFQPSLREAQDYWRAVGYFSSSALEAFGAPLGEFIKRGGSIRLVTSVELSETDLAAIRSGARQQDVCERRLEQIIDEEFAEGIGDGAARLGRLIELGRLELRIAVPSSGTGVYHEKIGVFLAEDDYVAFTGSSNESRSAFEHNRECIDVYPSWSSPRRAARKREHFEDLWERRDKGVKVYTFPEAAKRKLLRACGTRPQRPFESVTDTKWRHQDEAVQVFLKAERGVLEMATGTGKTRTAISILKTLFLQNLIDTVIVSADGNDLLDQWYDELLGIRGEIDQKPTILRQYKDNRQLQDFNLDPETAILLSSREPLSRALRQLSNLQARRTFLVHDEVHRIGSPGNRERLSGLSDAIRYRLGLSATPERIYDQEGTEFIGEHIGPVLLTFGLEEAIERGILAPFDYFPLSYEPSAQDQERIKALYSRFNARGSEEDPMTEEELYMKISQVHKTSDAKLPIFSEFINNHQQLLQRCIIFTETVEYAQDVLEIVHRFRPDFHTYFSGEDSATLERFAHGDLECLVTCHRLSEGIDIRSLSSVILFSSDRARLETIQRVGRCLRTDPNSPSKVAHIVDFVRQGSSGDSRTPDQERSDWLAELSRVRPKC